MLDFTEYFKSHKDEIIKNIIDFISIPSVLEECPNDSEAPFGKANVDALKFILNLGKKMGFETYNCDNVCGHIEYGEGEEVFAILCHSDVVPAIGDWDKDPFFGYVKDGKIYGRGSSDDKGPAIVSLYALKALKDMGIKVNKKIRLIIGTDEESGSRCVKHYFEKVGMPDMGISPDADFPIIYGEKGMITLDVVGLNEDEKLIKAEGGARYNIVAPSSYLEYRDNIDFIVGDNTSKIDSRYVQTGKSAHAMEPKNGVNAIVDMCKKISTVSCNNLIKFISNCLDDSRLKTIGLNFSTEEMGDMTMNVGLLNIDSNESRVGLNIRYPQGFNYNEFIGRFSAIAREYNLKIEVVSHSEPHYIDPNCDFIKTLHASYKKYTNNDNSPLKTIGGGTYARSMKLAVAFGTLFPWEKEMAHETNEYVDIENLLKAGAIIADATYNLCK